MENSESRKQIELLEEALKLEGITAGRHSNDRTLKINNIFIPQVVPIHHYYIQVSANDNMGASDGHFSFELMLAFEVCAEGETPNADEITRRYEVSSDYLVTIMEYLSELLNDYPLTFLLSHDEYAEQCCWLTFPYDQKDRLIGLLVKLHRMGEEYEIARQA